MWNLTYSRDRCGAKNRRGDPCARALNRAAHAGGKTRERRARARDAAGFIEPCLPTASRLPLCGPEWVYEIKHHGYRLLVRKVGERVRIYTRRGAHWTERFPRIVEAVQHLRASSVMLEGECVVCGPDGVSDFNDQDRAPSCRSSLDALTTSSPL